jgi:3'-5' exonuclease
MNAFIFDIETIPDLENGRKLLGLENFSDEEVAEAMTTMRRMHVGHDFFPHHLQKIIVISIVWHKKNDVKIWSIGDKGSSEKEIIERFFSGIEKYCPTLVSWNGTNFDLPVLQYRSLIHGIRAPKYWEVGETDPKFRYNNYINRYHYRHLDIMDLLANFSPRAYAPLDDIAKMLNLPGKITLHGKEVFPEFQKGNLEKIRDYCELDVLNTYLVYLRFENLRGQISEIDYQNSLNKLREVLENERETKSHFRDFLKGWTN